jgi:hypothetical protein
MIARISLVVSRQALQEFDRIAFDFGEGKLCAAVPGADQRPQLVDVAGLAGFENEAVHAPDRFRQALKIVDDLRQGGVSGIFGLPFVIFAIL